MKKEQENNPLVEVYNGSLWQADLVKGLLKANNIPSILKNETSNVFTSPYNEFAGVVRVFVDEADKEIAQKLIEERGQIMEEEN